MKSYYSCLLSMEMLRGWGGRALAGWLIFLARPGCFPQLGERTQSFPASSNPGDVDSWVKSMPWSRGSFCSPVKYSAFPKSHLLTHFVLITPSAQAQGSSSGTPLLPPPCTHFTRFSRAAYVLYVCIWINLVDFDFHMVGESQACERDFLYISHHIISLLDWNACDFTLGRRETWIQLNYFIRFDIDYPEWGSNKIFFFILNLVTSNMGLSWVWCHLLIG